MELRHKTALITGAGRRIGRAVALSLAGRGARVVLHYHHSRREAEALKREIEDLGGEAVTAHEDFSAGRGSVTARIRRFAAAVERRAPVDILINNAAIFYRTPLGRISEKIWDDFHTVNLKAPFFLAQEFGLRMKKRGRGKIVNLTDWTALRPHPDFLPYATAKAGLAAATTGLARALAPAVQVISIAPGPVLPAKGMSKKHNRAAAQHTLLKRFGDPNDIAAAVRFFVEDTDFITGVFLPVDGGALIA